MSAVGHGPVRNTLQLSAVIVATMFAVAGAADKRWRLDLAGGELAIPSAVKPSLRGTVTPSLFESSFRGEQIARSPFKSGPSYAVGIGYQLTDWVEISGHFQHSMPRYDPHTVHIRVDDTGPTFAVPVLKSHLEFFSASIGGRLYLRRPTSTVRPWLVSEVGWYRGTVQLHDLPCGGPSSDCSFSVNQVDDGFGVNVGGGVDFAVTRWLSSGLDLRYHNALTVLGGFDFVTALVDVGIHL